MLHTLGLADLLQTLDSTRHLAVTVITSTATLLRNWTQWCLQAVGLAVLMAKAGLAVPAAHPVKLPPFSRVLADIGDEQSLASSLSTFSGHLNQIQAGACRTSRYQTSALRQRRGKGDA